MIIAAEIALVVGIVIVASSYVWLTFGQPGERALLAALGVIVALAGFAAVAFVLALATDRWDWEAPAACFGGLVAAAAAQAAALGLRRALRRLRSVEEEADLVLAELDAAVSAGAAQRQKELERTLARERAETVHLLAEQERRIREERRSEAGREAEQAREDLVASVAANQRRLEERLSAWSSDLERSQRMLKARLEDLIQRQADALAGHEARLADHAKEVETLEEEQQTAIARVRTDLEHLVAEASATAQAEIETHATERRRALHEVGERLRTRERALREQIEREEVEVRAMLAGETADVERRALEQLERLIERATLRLSEDAERRFDAQLRESRERTADRLSRELELQMETFSRSAEKEVASRIAEAAHASALKLQRQIDDVVRAAEAQTTLSNERIQTLNERLERSLELANERLAEFEASVELEVSAKLGEIERALRAAEQSVERSS